jgi:GNAT superfamily N-acetyltransferase
MPGLFAGIFDSKEECSEMKNIEIIRLVKLPMDDIQPLVVESRAQGFEFLDRLVAEYVEGINRFDKPGEALFGVYWDENLIAIGGLNQDPYLSESDIARVRHVYVLSAWRNQGIGKNLMHAIIGEAKGRFRLLTLRTFSAEADGFYRAIGFKTQPELQDVTHHLVLNG